MTYTYTDIRRVVDVVTGNALSEVYKDNLAEGLWQLFTPDSVILLTDAARELGISIRTITRMSDLPLIQLSRRRRGIRRADLRKWMDAHTKPKEENTT
jgi:hypothetical protein